MQTCGEKLLTKNRPPIALERRERRDRGLTRAALRDLLEAVQVRVDHGGID